MGAFDVPLAANGMGFVQLRFKQHAELMFTGPLRYKSEAEKCSFLMLWIRDKGRDKQHFGSNGG